MSARASKPRPIADPSISARDLMGVLRNCMKPERKHKPPCFDQASQCQASFLEIRSRSRMVASVKTDMPERGWLYVKGKATQAESWHVITSIELPY